ncbi:LysR family transcriptional regulator [Dictyobacter alpinus]|uniref:LysR family transcriptional regulator n=1 Tax=Dictyobacter alpinus TaxID=2014873 RepID=A0A402BCF5_9CHLR|nr:LysR family transcriptional regulator [Dictyobacter alpinus]GCE29091.1 LysR family transcriptional regulator [Dictyobacter alpinus]
MELLQLKYFRTVARLQHMTRAAEELGIAQPALSQTIARLEAELGVPLFERTGRGIRLNHYGKAYIQHVERIFLELEQGQRELASISGGTQGQVELALSVATHLLPDILGTFRLEYPSIRFRLSQHDVTTMAQQLQRGAYDLCITSPPIQQADIESIVLLTEDIRLALPAWHPLAHRSQIALHEVADEAFICLKPEYSLRQLTDSFCQQAGFRPHIAFESDEPSTIRGLISAGLGISFVPALSWSGSVGSAVIELPISNPGCQRTLGLSWSTKHLQSEAARRFQHFVTNYFARLATHPNNKDG